MTSYLSALFRRSAHRKTYASLMQLDDRLLSDIGLTRTDLHQLMAGARVTSKTRTHE